MTLTELQNEVYVITNRPDLVGRTSSAIRAATLKLHQTDFYYKDLFETGISFSAANYLQQLEYRTLIPNWRTLKYVRKSDVNSTDTGKFLEVVTPESVLDSYGLNRNDVVYATGEVLQIRSSTELQYIFLGCYLNPNITLSGYSSWIALDHPFAIIYEAASQIFKQIGKSEEWQAYKIMANEQAAAIAVTNIQTVGI